jgi:hypothetical protein
LLPVSPDDLSLSSLKTPPKIYKEFSFTKAYLYSGTLSSAPDIRYHNNFSSQLRPYIKHAIVAKSNKSTYPIVINLVTCFNPVSAELNSICYLLALLAHDFLHVSRIRVKSLTLTVLMSYIYMEHLFLMFLDHTQRRSTVGRTPLYE